MKITNSFEKIILNKLIYFLMAIAFLLSIKQFSPFSSFDEREIINWIKDIDHNPAFAFKYPPLFVYMNLLLSKIYAIILSFLGLINTDSNFLASELGSSFTLEAGRIFNAFLSSLIVFITYKIGKSFFNQYMGLFAALLIAVNPLIILYSHIFKPGILTTLLVTSTFYFLLKYIKNRQTISIFWASIFCGLAISAKFNVFPLILSVFAAIFIANFEGKKPEFKKLMLFIPLGGIIGFFLGAPNWILNPIGNIKAFLSTYSPDKGIIFDLFQTKTMTAIWLEFLDDIKIYFGLVFLVIFILTIIYSIILRNINNVFIILSILFYVVIISYFGFYADRMSMPLFPLVAILIAKFLFYDLPEIFEKYKNINRINLLFKKVLLISLFPILVYAIIQIVYNIKTYNLLKTQSDSNYTIEYREQHNIDNKKHKYNIGRQIYTPRVKGKNIKIRKRFTLKFSKRDSKKKLHFMQVHFPSYRALLKGKLYPKVKKIDLTKHRPFYIIKKREYQPENPECIYLYNVAPELLKINPKRIDSVLGIPEKIQVPKVFYESKDTSFLPLQIYEQNPNFGITKNGFYTHWIYSKEKIKKIKFYFINLSKKKSTSLILNVNKIEKNFNIGNKVKIIVLENLKPKFFYFDYIYKIEIKNNNSWKHKALDESYFVFEPMILERRNNNRKKPVLFKKTSLVLSEKPDVPKLFSNQSINDWIKNYYYEYGIDLTLLQFIGTKYLKLNKERNNGTLITDLFPLKKGVYKLEIDWKNKNQELYILEYTSYTSKGKYTSYLKLSKNNQQSILLQTNAEIGFFRLKIKSLFIDKDIQLDRISITPDLNILK